ncbi:MAG: polymerase beta subunit [Mahella sp.]|nr:polymerase beta subunit [Mahella sp.]
MIITCEKDDLVNALSIAEKALPSKNIIPVLNSIIIETVDDIIHLKSTDTEISIDTVLNGNIINQGSVALNGRLFIDIARSLPKEQVTINVDDHNEVSIKCGLSEISIKGMGTDDFPQLPVISDGTNFNISSVIFRDMIRQTAFSIAPPDDNREMLTGELLKFENDKIMLVSVDGYRISIRYEDIDEIPDRQFEAVIPGKALMELMRILPSAQENLNIKIDDKRAAFSINGTVMTAQLLSSKFINYEDILMPELSETKTTITVSRADLLSATERAMLVAKEGKSSLIKLSISERGMVLTSNADIGKVHEDIPIDIDGSAIEIAFNGRYLTDPLKVIDDEQVLMKFNSDVSPCIIEPVEGKSFLYLILPVRMG